MNQTTDNDIQVQSNFIHNIINKDLKRQNFNMEIHTRFPPEPNGYLHIGSAYAINISYNIAKKYNGKFNLRFDDTNPQKENIEYVDSILDDMKWLGFDPGNGVFYGSDYFEEIYKFAVELIKDGKAYVCNLNSDQIREYRGTLKTTGIESPYRNRSVDENIELFDKMKKGIFPEGYCVLRAKIDMKSPNINMRDPVIYRIQNVSHYKTGTTWNIYPMYDFAHPIQDYIENISHSLCSIEFKDHRPLYEWVLNSINVKNQPKQIEFGRMNISGGITSKRYLRELVYNNYVDGWDDPRLPTIKGLRRRGYTPTAIKSFLNDIGVSRSESTVDISMLENSLRNDLKNKVKNAMVVIDPIKVIITNYPNEKIELLDARNNPNNPDLGNRELSFGKILYIEKSDFCENPSENYHRLSLNGEVRLMNAYFIKCNKVIKDKDTGEILELHCTYDPETKSGSGFNKRKVKGTIHWISYNNFTPLQVNVYNSLILDNENKNLMSNLNPNSKKTYTNCLGEKWLSNLNPEEKVQFIRHGFFCVDNKYNNEKNLIFNRSVSLKKSNKY